MKKLVGGLVLLSLVILVGIFVVQSGPLRSHHGYAHGTFASARACAPGDGSTAVEVALVVGRPLPNRDRQVAGTVNAMSTSGRSCRIGVATDRTSQFPLAPDTYSFTGRTPAFLDGKQDCSAPGRVRVRRGPSSQRPSSKPLRGSSVGPNAELPIGASASRPVSSADVR